jgi:sulfur carrier protein
MNVRINGELREVPDTTTVSGLLAHLGLEARGIAVAVDRAVVPRAVHPTTVLCEGCEVEVIRAVGGG